MAAKCRYYFGTAVVLLAAVIAAGLFHSVTGGNAGGSASLRTSAHSAALRIADYNLCVMTCPHLATWSTNRVDRIAASIEAIAPDVIVTLETGNVQTAAELETRLATYRIAEGAGGSYIFYRPDVVKPLRGIANGGTLAVQGPSPAGPHANRRVLDIPFQSFVDLRTQAGFTVVGIHLTAYDLARDDVARESEMTQILARTSPPRRPVMYVGDFNSYAQPPDARFDSAGNRWRVNALLTARGYSDAVAVAAHTSNARYNSLNQEPTDHRNFGPYRHLDHLYVDSHITVRRWTMVRHHGSYAEQESDHNMVYADLTVRGTRVTRP